MLGGFDNLFPNKISNKISLFDVIFGTLHL